MTDYAAGAGSAPITSGGNIAATGSGITSKVGAASTAAANGWYHPNGR